MSYKITPGDTQFFLFVLVARHYATATVNVVPAIRMRPAARDVYSILGVPTVTKLAVRNAFTPLTIPLQFATELGNVSSDVRKPSEARSV